MTGRMKLKNKYSPYHNHSREHWHASSMHLRKNYCQLCGNNSGELHCHHIVPLRLGGRSSATNCITLCYGCHKEVHQKMASLLLKYFEDKQDELFNLLIETITVNKRIGDSENIINNQLSFV